MAICTEEVEVAEGEEVLDENVFSGNEKFKAAAKRSLVRMSYGSRSNLPRAGDGDIKKSSS